MDGDGVRVTVVVAEGVWVGGGLGVLVAKIDGVELLAIMVPGVGVGVIGVCPLEEFPQLANMTIRQVYTKIILNFIPSIDSIIGSNYTRISIGRGH